MVARALDSAKGNEVERIRCSVFTLPIVQPMRLIARRLKIGAVDKLLLDDFELLPILQRDCKVDIACRASGVDPEYVGHENVPGRCTDDEIAGLVLFCDLMKCLKDDNGNLIEPLIASDGVHGS